MMGGDDHPAEPDPRSSGRGFWKPHARALLDALKVAPHAAPAGTALLHQGDPVGHVFALFNGWAIQSQVFRDGRRQILDVLLPGRIFGFEALRRGEARYSVVAITEISYGTIERSVLSLLSARPELASALFETVLDEHEGAHRRLAWMGHYTAEERLAALLVDLHARLTSLGLVRGDGAFPLPLTQQQLADLVGFNAVHVNRVLRRLRARRLVTLEDHMARIDDPASLARIVPMQGGRAQPDRAH